MTVRGGQRDMFRVDQPCLCTCRGDKPGIFRGDQVCADHCPIIWLICVVTFLKSECPSCLGVFKR